MLNRSDFSQETADDALCARNCLEARSCGDVRQKNHQKRAWSNAVQLWLIGVICGSDAGNVCPVAACNAQKLCKSTALITLMMTMRLSG